MQVGYIEQTAGRALGSGRQAASCCIRMISNTATLTDPVDSITTGAETLFRQREFPAVFSGLVHDDDQIPGIPIRFQASRFLSRGCLRTIPG